MLFNSSKLKHPPAPFSICQATISFSDSVRKLGFYLDKDSLWKNPPISSAKLLSCKSAISVLFATTSLMIPLKPFLFLSSSHALTIATLSWLVSLSPWAANFRVQNNAAHLVVHTLPHVHVTPVLRHSHWFAVRGRISYNIVSLCFNAITSSTLLMSLTYICTLLLDLFAPVPTPAYSKFHFISTRRKVIVLSLILDLLSGTHCHCTSEMLQLSTPSSLLLKKKLSLQPPRIWLTHVCLIFPV